MKSRFGSIVTNGSSIMYSKSLLNNRGATGELMDTNSTKETQSTNLTTTNSANEVHGLKSLFGGPRNYEKNFYMCVMLLIMGCLIA